ncbi:hypothetical protein A0O32_0417 [Anoxybacillus flavithermus]|uniref:Uncharacterized protein n=1 Tax=Anoxybacillus flavithermus TaxID=33934 RepID=A0A178TLJ3_9BACL|nr:hypothetical protein TAF16_0258 [Anoxybacillus flavithermus]OAO83169.1 hypothetical protein A0O32_0417 [Anoxybacillus flavithermus]
MRLNLSLFVSSHYKQTKNFVNTNISLLENKFTFFRGP